MEMKATGLRSIAGPKQALPGLGPWGYGSVLGGLEAPEGLLTLLSPPAFQLCLLPPLFQPVAMVSAGQSPYINHWQPQDGQVFTNRSS